MGKIRVKLSSVAHSKQVASIKAVKGVQSIDFKGGNLLITVDDALEREDVVAISRKLRLITGLAYQLAYSDSYDVHMPSYGFNYTAQDSYKKEILQRELHPTKEYLSRADRLFEDILSSKQPDEAKDTLIFNLMYIWVRALELQLLHQPVEAQTILGEIVESMKEQGKDIQGGKVIRGFGIIQTPADKFAAGVLQALGRDKYTSSKDEFDGFTYLYRLRKRQKTIFQGSVPYYLGEKIHNDTAERNPFLFEMTKLYILWLLGLENYYLKRMGSTFRLARRTTKEVKA